jgi:transcriptional regulator with XRE-family HTH domain
MNKLAQIPPEAFAHNSNARLSPFGIVFRKLRIDKGMRIFDVAQKIGFSPSSVSAWETGRRQFPTELLEKLQEELKLSDEQIAALNEAAENSREPIVISPRSAEARILAESFKEKINSLTPQQIKDIVKHFKCSVVRGIRPDFWVLRRTRAAIAAQAQLLRQGLGLKRNEPIDIVKIFDLELPKLFGDQLDYQIVPDSAMEQYTVGISTLFPPTIKISNSKYEDAANGGFGGKWVLAHELGHIWLLHGHEYLTRYLTNENLIPISPMRGAEFPDLKRPPVQESAEWQADEFAAELFMPRSICRKLQAHEIVNIFGVSKEIAEKRLAFLKPRKRRPYKYHYKTQYN